MHPYPHRYQVSVRAGATGEVTLDAAGLPALKSQPPPEFDGPPGYWSPETLLVAAIADCYVLSFRALAAASRFDWQDLSAEVEGTLERVEGVSRFTRYVTRARLTVAAGADQTKAEHLMHRAEKLCLISNSLNGERQLEIEVQGA